MPFRGLQQLLTFDSHSRYISEISPPEIRGTLLVLQELSIVTGIVIAFYITYGTRYMAGDWSWRLPFLIQMTPAIVLAAGVTFLPFTPRWLCQVGRDEEALKTLSKLRQVPEDDPRVLQEWYEIRSEVAYRKELMQEKYPHLQDGTVKSRLLLQANNWADTWRGRAWRRTQVGVGLMVSSDARNCSSCIARSLTLCSMVLVLPTGKQTSQSVRLRLHADPVRSSLASMPSFITVLPSSLLWVLNTRCNSQCLECSTSVKSLHACGAYGVWTGSGEGSSCWEAECAW